jgi:hypothetical protein
MHPKTLEMLKNPAFPGYYQGEAKGRAEGEEKGRAEGEAKGRAKSVLKVLAKRGLTPTPEQERRIIDCRDLDQLDIWFDRAFTVTAVDELFA